MYNPINLHNSINLVEVIKSSLSIDVDIRRVDEESKDVDAWCEIYERSNGEEKFKITVSKHNECWTRYLVCKELSQRFLYSPDNSTKTVSDVKVLLGHLANAMPYEMGSNVQVDADFAAYYAAIEFLVPSDIVPRLHGMRERLVVSGEVNPNFRIAEYLKAPEVIVEYRLDNDNLFTS